MAADRMTQGTYVHALRFSFLTGLYDPVVAWTTRERTFKQALLAGANLRAGARVLDVGCGTGTLACMALALAPGIEMHGVDGDPQILQRAREKARARGLAPQFSEGMSDALPYPDGSCDRVLSSLFFHHLTTDAKRATLAQMHRVLAPGGELHIADWGAPQDPLMRLAFLGIQLLDGFATTRDHAAGALPRLVAEAGFARVATGPRWRTLFGTMEIVRAVRAESHS
jgi:ubiquinone/menaquinone biosynthesis C-methylase UbiE